LQQQECSREAARAACKPSSDLLAAEQAFWEIVRKRE
jgi:hypothetical protein